MFDKLSAASPPCRGLRGRGRLTEENVAETMRQVRMACSRPTSRCRSSRNSSTAVKRAPSGSRSTRALTPGQRWCG